MKNNLYLSLSAEMAEQIKNALAQTLDEDIHVVGDNGTIIATTHPERLGTLHEGAAKVVTGEINFSHINGKSALRMSGVRPGYGVPISIDDHIVGVIGVSGEPERVKPYAQVAAAFARLMINNHILEKALLRHMEVALQESEEKYRLIAENFPNGIIVLYDREWRIMMIEGKGLEQIGLSREMLLGKRISEVFPRNFVWEVEPHLYRALAGEESTFEISWNDYVFEQTVVPFRSGGNEISAVMGVIENITTRKQAEEKAFFLTHHDALTNLPNRTIFNDRLQQAIIQAERDNQTLAVIFIDLDHFKSVNDSLGHAGGDRLLRVLAERLFKTLRKSDTVARAGGDEFLILTTQMAQLENTMDVLQRIKDSFSEPFQIGHNDCYITCTAGIAMFPDDGRDGETLIKNAHMAMHNAKEEGRNNYRFCTPAIKGRALHKLKLKNSLHRALEREEFTVFYQPQVSMKSGKITGMEALLRWQHPERGLVSPGEFINMAEESGLIVPLGEWVLSRVCAQKKSWLQAGLPPFRVAVNLSVRQFQQKDLLSRIRHIIENKGLDYSCLELEVTENVAMVDPLAVAKMLRQFKDMGLTISIDDFGTEYSSLSYLKILPVDKIKIAIPFVQGIEKHSRDGAIVAAIIVLAQNLGFKVIAEGVETKKQLDFLRQHLCDEVQGFYFHRPMPAWEIEKLLSQNNHKKMGDR